MEDDDLLEEQECLVDEGGSCERVEVELLSARFTTGTRAKMGGEGKD